MRIAVTWGELLLLDYMLCEPLQNVGPEHVEWLIQELGRLRRRVWQAEMLFPRDAIEARKAGPVAFELESEPEAELLLALTPTTFRWADGPDVGLDLKRKLAYALDGPDETQQAATAAVEEMLKGEQKDASSPSASQSPDAYDIADAESDPWPSS